MVQYTTLDKKKEIPCENFPPVILKSKPENIKTITKNGPELKGLGLLCLLLTVVLLVTGIFLLKGTNRNIRLQNRIKELQKEKLDSSFETMKDGMELYHDNPKPEYDPFYYENDETGFDDINWQVNDWIVSYYVQIHPDDYDTLDLEFDDFEKLDTLIDGLMEDLLNDWVKNVDADYYQ